VESIDRNIKIVRNKIFSSNTYFLIDELEERCVIVDPGLDRETLMTEIKQSGLRPVAILATHGHFDHIGCADDIRKEFSIPFFMHESDLKILRSANFFLQVAKINHKINTPEPDFLFKNKQDKFHQGNFDIEVYNFPGHSYGSCIFKSKSYLFTGDILYKNGLGKESMPREDKNLLKESIQEIISKFSDDCLVLPGHGPFAYLGDIKQNNLDLKSFISN